MVERVDAVVVGAGLGGLAAGVTLAGEGRRTVVLEQHSVAGGYATGFQRGPYRFDAALHALNGLAPGGGAEEVYRALDIWDRVRLQRLDPLYVLRGGGREIVAHADVFRYEDELIRTFPEHAAGIRSLMDEHFAVYRDSRRFAVDMRAGRTCDFEQMVARYPALVRVSGETWDAMMRRHIDDAELRAVMGAYWPYAVLPPTRLSAVMGASMASAYHHHGGWYPAGGAQALSAALVEVLRERGGEVRHGHLVTDVHRREGRAVAVATSQGLRLEADLFVWNASAPALLDAVGDLPAGYAERVRTPSPGFGTFAVYLGLGRDVFAEQGIPHEIFFHPRLDSDALLRAALAGDVERSGMVITDYTQVDPGCAPEGHASVVVTTMLPWQHEDVWGTGGDLQDYHRNARYLQFKEEVAERLLRAAEEAVPGLTSDVRYREASTPLTNFQYTRNPGGTIEGYENTVENSGMGWLPQETPLENLFLAGAWTNGGGMNPAMESGVGAARKALTTAPMDNPVHA